MAQVNAGRVRFVSRGEYNNSTQYYLFDLVDYNGSSYFAKANTTGNVPTNTTYWQLVAEKGNTGGDGPVGPTGNGIASITKTASAGLIDTYTITFTDGTTSTFEITNGQDGEVTQEYVDEHDDQLRTLFNVLPKVSDSGESIELENTGDTMIYKMDLKGNTSQEVIQGEVGLEVEDTSIYVDDVNEDKENYITLKGNTYQETTTGKNLFDKSTISSVAKGTNNNGVITSNTMSNEGINLMPYFSNMPVSDGDTIYISADIKLNSGSTGSINNINDGVIAGFTKNIFPTLSTNYQRYQTSYTYSSNTNITKILFQFFNVTGTIEISNIMISKNSNVDYEPYTNGASPNPDYPQDVEVVTGLNEVKVEGKNLLENTLTSQTISGVTFTKNSDGTITANGTANANIYLNLNTEVTLNAGTYILSGCPSGGSSSTYTLYENSVGYNKFDYGSGLDITLTETKTFRVSLAIYSGTSVNNLVFKPMIEKGSQATTYEAYQGASYPVNLGSIELCKIGTYKDQIYKSLIDNNWYVHKEIGKVVLDGTQTIESMYTSSTNTARLNYSNIAKNFYVGGLCNILKVDNNVWGNDIEGLYQEAWNDHFYFRINKSTIGTTMQEANTYLSNNNLIFYGALRTPTDTQITDTTLVNQLNALYNATIYSTTHINTETSNLLPYIDLKYNVVTASPSPDRASEVKVVTGNNTITISNEDGTKTQTFNINLGSLEFCKIGDYQDYIYYDKSADKWYKYGAIDKTTDVVGSTSITINNMVNNGGMYSFYGGTLNGKTITYDSALLRQNTIYYPLATPTTTQITDQLLVSQLDELQKAMSYYDKTIITQTNADKPFILDVIGIRDLQDIFNL